MKNPASDGTIDWNRYWTDSDDAADDDANASVVHVSDALFEFLDAGRVPDSLADVGCGGGALATEIAERYPGTEVVGYDASESVLARNRERVRDGGNLSFERTVLPEFEPGRQFEVVTCFFTLCYVREVERAIRALYDAVAPGGSLVLTYHNRFAQSLFREIAASPAEYLDEESPWDPERFADRFRLVLDGESLLSYDRIHAALGTWPRSLWSTVDADRYGAWRQNPLVYVPK